MVNDAPAASCTMSPSPNVLQAKKEVIQGTTRLDALRSLQQQAAQVNHDVVGNTHAERLLRAETKWARERLKLEEKVEQAQSRLAEVEQNTRKQNFTLMNKNQLLQDALNDAALDRSECEKNILSMAAKIEELSEKLLSAEHQLQISFTRVTVLNDEKKKEVRQSLCENLVLKRHNCHLEHFIEQLQMQVATLQRHLVVLTTSSRFKACMVQRQLEVTAAALQQAEASNIANTAKLNAELALAEDLKSMHTTALMRREKCLKEENSKLVAQLEALEVKMRFLQDAAVEKEKILLNKIAQANVERDSLSHKLVCAGEVAALDAKKASQREAELKEQLRLAQQEKTMMQTKHVDQTEKLQRTALGLSEKCNDLTVSVMKLGKKDHFRIADGGNDQEETCTEPNSEHIPNIQSLKKYQNTINELREELEMQRDLVSELQQQMDDNIFMRLLKEEVVQLKSERKQLQHQVSHLRSTLENSRLDAQILHINRKFVDL